MAGFLLGAGRHVRRHLLDPGDSARARTDLRRQSCAGRLSVAVVVLCLAGGAWIWGPSVRPLRAKALDRPRLRAARSADGGSGPCAELRVPARLPGAARVVHAGAAHCRRPVCRGGIRTANREPSNGLLRVVPRRRRSHRAGRGRPARRRRRLALGDRDAGDPPAGRRDRDATLARPPADREHRRRNTSRRSASAPQHEPHPGNRDR